MTSGLPAPPLPPGRSPLTLTVHAGGTLSTKVPSADACGSASWRAPSLLKSTKATTVSAPALVPGSVTMALPFGVEGRRPGGRVHAGDRVAHRPARVGHARRVDGGDREVDRDALRGARVRRVDLQRRWHGVARGEPEGRGRVVAPAPRPWRTGPTRRRRRCRPARRPRCCRRSGSCRRRAVDLAPHLVGAAAVRECLIARPRRGAGDLDEAPRVAGVGVGAADELRRALRVDAGAAVAAVEEEVGRGEGLEVRGAHVGVRHLPAHGEELAPVDVARRLRDHEASGASPVDRVQLSAGQPRCRCP